MDSRKLNAHRARPSRLREFVREYGGVVFVLVLLAMLAHTIFADSGYLAMRRMQQDMEVLNNEIRELHDENRRLAEEVQSLKTDPKTIERIAREEMGLAKPGELIFKLPPKPDSPKPAPRPQEQPQQ
ncbi:MAG TPA: septum formation initiator family protein [Candidatus Acidoferrales bacterium]